MSIFDIAAFVLPTLGALVALLPDLLSGRRRDGADALDGKTAGDPEADAFLGDMRNNLRIAARIADRNRRALRWLGGLLVVLGAMAFTARFFAAG